MLAPARLEQCPKLAFVCAKMTTCVSVCCRSHAQAGAEAGSRRGAGAAAPAADQPRGRHVPGGCAGVVCSWHIAKHPLLSSHHYSDPSSRHIVRARSASRDSRSTARAVRSQNTVPWIGTATGYAHSRAAAEGLPTPVT